MILRLDFENEASKKVKPSNTNGFYSRVRQEANYFLDSVLWLIPIFGWLDALMKKKKNCLFYGNAIFHSKYMPSPKRKTLYRHTRIKNNRPMNCTRNMYRETFRSH